MKVYTNNQHSIQVSQLQGAVRALLMMLMFQQVAYAAMTEYVVHPASRSGTGLDANGTTNMTMYQGKTPDLFPTFYRITAFDQLLMPLAGSKKDSFSVMFWFRMHSDLFFDPELSVTQMKLFDLGDSVECRVEKVSNNLILFCEEPDTGLHVQVRLSDQLPDTNAWIHFTLSSNGTDALLAAHSLGKYVNATQEVNFTLPADQREAHFGDTNATGFIGDLHDFMVTDQTIDMDQIANVMHTVQTWDRSILGYYRFPGGSLKDEFHAYTARWLQGAAPDAIAMAPVWDYEDATNFVCDPVNKQGLYPFVTGGELMADPLKLPADSLEPERFNHRLDIWIMPESGFCYDKDPTSGPRDCYFFSIPEVLTLWYTSPGSFRVYVHALDEWQAFYSKPMFLALRQWMNIQIELDQENGLTIEVFNAQGHLQDGFRADRFVGIQRPKDEVILFGKQFYGGVMKFVWWNNQPTSTPEDQAFVYYDFDTEYGQEYYTNLGEAKIDEFSCRDLTRYEFRHLSGPTDEIDKSQGTFDATEPLYNGISCTNYNMTGVSVDLGGSMRYLTGIDNLNEFTIEFWFRFNREDVPAPDEPVDLFSIEYPGVADYEVMQVYVDTDGSLNCAPFGRVNRTTDSEGNEVPFTKATFQMEANYSDWQHVACSYKQGRFINAYAYQPTLINDTNVATTQTVQLVATDPQRIVALSASRNWYINIGDADLGYFLQLKELRLWNKILSVEEIIQNRQVQAQVNQDDLLFYLKLNTGSEVPYNFAEVTQVNDIPDPVFNSEQYFSLRPIDFHTPIVPVCSTERFYSSDANLCSANPFSEGLWVTYYGQYDSDDNLQLVLTTDYSPQLQGQTIVPQSWQYEWSTTHKATNDGPLASQKNQQTVVFNADSIGDGYKYEFAVKVTDPEKSAFFEEISMDIIMQQCKLVVDKDSEQAVGNTKYLRSEDYHSKQDLCFEIEEQTVKRCNADYYDNFLVDKVAIRAYPNIAQEALDQYDITSTSSKIEVCIPAAQTAYLPEDTEITFVISAFWSSSSSSSTDAHMDVVYTVVYKTDISLQLRVLNGNTNLEADEALKLEAYSSQTNDIYYDYKWTCGGFFQRYCNIYQGSKYVEISYDAFILLGGIAQTEYLFEVTVWNQKLGSAAADISELSMTSSVNALWTTQEPPQFDLEIAEASEDGDGNGNLIVPVTQDVFVQIRCSNYRTNNQNLNMAYQFVPSIAEEYLSFSNERNILVINKDGLQKETSYSLTMDLDINYNDVSVTNRTTLEFRTSDLPTPGSVSVTPTSGDYQTTSFKFDIDGWTSDYEPLYYRLLAGIVNDTQSSLEPITGYFTYNIKNSGTDSTITYQLPYANQYAFEFLDSLGNQEFLYVQVELDSEITTVQDWIDVLDFGFSEFESTISSFFSTQNRLAAGRLSAELAQSPIRFNDENTKQNDLDSLLNATLAMNYEISALIESQLMELKSRPQANNGNIYARSMLTLLNQTTAEIGVMNNTIASWAKDSLSYLMPNITVEQEIIGFDSSYKESNTYSFINNLIAVNSNLFNYQYMVNKTEQEQEATGRRLIEITNQDSYDQVSEFFTNMNTITENVCMASTLPIREKQIFSYGQAELQVIKYEITDTADLDDNLVMGFEDEQFQHGKISLVIPSKELILQSKQFNMRAEEVCLQVAFYSFEEDVLYPFAFDQQVMESKTAITITSIDEDYDQLIGTETGLKDLIIAPMIIYFPYDFEANKDNFVANQTVCMSISQEALFKDYTIYDEPGQIRFETHDCLTLYRQEENLIQCMCGSVENRVYRLVTDYSRVAASPRVDEEITDLYYLPMIVFFALFGFAGPCIVIKQDQLDYQGIEDDIYQVDENMQEEFVRIRGLQVPEEVFYKFRQIEKYKNRALLQMQENAQNSEVTWTYNYKMLREQCHPVWGLVYRFDYRFNRLSRYSVYLFQLLLITLIQQLMFNQDSYAEMSDDDVFKQALIIGFLTSLITLPLPDKFTSCFYQKIRPVDGNSARKEGEEEESEFSSRCLKWKLAFIIFTYLGFITYWIILILCLVDKFDSLDIDERQTQMFAISFGIAIVFGIFILNGIRILLLSCAAPRKALQLIEKEDAVYQQDKEAIQEGCCCKCFNCLTLPQLAVDTALDVQTVFNLTQKLHFAVKQKSSKQSKKQSSGKKTTPSKKPKQSPTTGGKSARSVETNMKTYNQDQSQDDMQEFDSENNDNELEMVRQKDRRI